MVYRAIRDAEKNRKLNRYIITIIGLTTVFLTVYIGYRIKTHSLEETEFTLTMTFFLAFATMVISMIQWLNIDTNNNRDKLKECEIEQIKDSIDMFYVPLLNLLFIYNENVTSKTKERIIIEVNSHTNI